MHKKKEVVQFWYQSNLLKVGAVVGILIIVMLAVACVQTSNKDAEAEVKYVQPSMSAIATPTK